MLVDKGDQIMEKRVPAGDATILENYIDVQETQPKNEQMPMAVRLSDWMLSLMMNFAY
jgi:hypothetical protein